MFQEYFDNLKTLVDICHQELSNNNHILSYFKSRNYTDSTIQQFKFGAFPSDLRKIIKYVDSEILISTGIIFNASESSYKKIYPIIIPIQDINSNYIGIAGRTFLSDEQREIHNLPKYKNSIYKKGSHLFGLNFSKDYIRQTNEVNLVEGQFDMISAFQHNLKNTVGVCGAILTKKQLTLLARYAKNINILFDNDCAGDRVSDKILNMYDKLNEFSIKRIQIPKQFKDIDEYLNSNQ